MKTSETSPAARVTSRVLDNVSNLIARISIDPPSRFTPEQMPAAIYRRNLNQCSVHYSPATFKWIATINRSTVGFEGRKTCRFSFPSEQEARKFCKSYAPPKIMPISTKCLICTLAFDKKVRPNHCRNCGVCICDECSTRWSIRMMPETYVDYAHTVTMRVCKSCDWLSNAFCMALLEGKMDFAVQLVETGNVNLRSTFANINREAMFPVHCAVMGGNLTLIKWLVESHGCPISVKRDNKTGRMLSIQTSADRTLIDLAMTGKPKLDILRYLVTDNNMSVMDTKNATLAPRCLEALLRAGDTPMNDLRDLNIIQRDQKSIAESSTTIDDACIFCCDKSMDCVLIPCGHQICCLDCGTKLSNCPVCKVSCQILRIFRQ